MAFGYGTVFVEPWSSQQPLRRPYWCEAKFTSESGSMIQLGYMRNVAADTDVVRYADHCHIA
jgi:hypothetical protein